MATVAVTGEQRLLLHDIGWRTYETLLKEFDERPIRLTYDRGSLEIMTLSYGHENYAELLSLFIIVLTEELRVPRHSGGSTTFKREALQRGLEPDRCYWIQNELRMRGKKDFDIETDPPPDLAIEVEISRGALNRMAIYAALGVAEVWRFDGDVLKVHRLEAGQKYAKSDHSPTFPHLPIRELAEFLRASDAQDETSLELSFRAWVRQHVLPAHQASQVAEKARSDQAPAEEVTMHSPRPPLKRPGR
jgi:Uma2 family endonuclease